MTPSPSIVNDYSEHKIALKFYSLLLFALVCRTLFNKKSKFFKCFVQSLFIDRSKIFYY